MLLFIAIILPFNIVKIGKTKHDIHIRLWNIKANGMIGHSVPMIYPVYRIPICSRMLNGKVSNFPQLLYFHIQFSFYVFGKDTNLYH